MLGRRNLFRILAQPSISCAEHRQYVLCMAFVEKIHSHSILMLSDRKVERLHQTRKSHPEIVAHHHDTL